MTALKSFEPASGALLGEVRVTPREEIPDLLARARAAQPAWRDRGLEERARRLAALGDRIDERADELASLIAREVGRPHAEARREVRGCADVSAQLGGIAAALAHEERQCGGALARLEWEPHGVCAALTSWTLPLALPHALALPALAAGNAVILKPSELAPLTARAYAEILADLVPAGAVQIGFGAGAQGRTLAAAADVDAVALAGSKRAGEHAAAAASARLAPAILELQGKTPLVILGDADVGAAAALAARHGFDNPGLCASPERVIAPAPVAAAVAEELATRAQALGRAGARPAASEAHEKRIRTEIRDARRRGARVLAGGDAEGAPYVPPTVLLGVTADMALGTEPARAPVIGVTEVESDEEALREAGDPSFGPIALVCGGDRARAATVGRGLRAGAVGLGTPAATARLAPWLPDPGGGDAAGAREAHRAFAAPRLVYAPA